MLPRKERLTSAAFDRAFRHPQAEMVRHPRVHLKFAPTGEAGQVRAAFVVPKKQGGAVQRNEVRRRLRERYRLHTLRAAYQLEGWDLIFLSTPGTAGATGAELDEALDNVINRAIKKARKWSEPSEPEVPTNESPLPAPEMRPGPTLANRPITAFALTLIRFYQQVVSPSLPPACRFYPTCSRYTYEAIERYGVLQGGGLGLRRLCRCHPWHPGGFDPVPENLTMGVRIGAWWRKLCAWCSRPGLCGRKFG